MSQGMSPVYWGDKAQRGQAQVMDLYYKITAAKTVSDLNKNTALTSFDAIASQSVIDDFLGTVDEFLVAAFDATAMGNDAFAAIVQMEGQASELLGATATCYSGSNGATVVTQGVAASSSLTASTLSTEAALGDYGNLAVRVAFGNTPDFDALTSGLIHLQLVYRSK